MEPSRRLLQLKRVFLLVLLACSSRAFAQSPQSGSCASCTSVDSSGTCPGSLPVCVDTSSGASSNLPCAELIAGAESAYNTNMAAQMQQSMAASMPSWMQANQPVMQQVPVPSAAELAAAKCPADKPSKMCCSAKAFGQSTTATGDQTGSTSSGVSQNQASSASSTSTPVDGAAGTSQQLATQQGIPVQNQGSQAAQTASKQTGGAAAVQGSVVVAAAGAGAAVLLQLL